MAKKNYTTAGIPKKELNKRIKSNRAVAKKVYQGGLNVAKSGNPFKTYKSIKKSKSLNATYNELNKKKKLMQKKPYGSSGGYN
jgi:hypothetical protein